MKSLAYEVARQGGVLPGLAPVRLMLACIVICCQSIEVTETFSAFSSSPLWPLPLIAWCGLFALLGYCLQAARASQSVRAFLLRRLRRFGPPYVFAIVVAALMIGPAASSSSVGNYLRDGESWAYFLNLVGAPRLTLPGVFEFNVLSGVVNAIVLWAPAAIILSGAIVAAPFARRWQAWILTGVALSVALFAVITALAGFIPESRDSLLHNLFSGPAVASLVAGLVGAIAWHVRRRLPLDRRIAAAAVVVIALMTMLRGESANLNPLISLPIALSTSYLVLQAVSRRRPGEAFATRVQGLLYPAMCFSFPFQQLAASADRASENAVINLAAALPPIIGAAAFWWWIEQRIVRKVDPVAATPVPPPSTFSRRRQSLADRAAYALWIAVVGAILIAVITALMALTGYALQRPAEGV